MYSKKRKSSSTKILLILSLLAALMGAALPAAATTPPNCGDGTLQENEGETCDDGNKTGGDGCSSSCQKEDGWVCNLQAKCNNQEEDEGEVCDPKSSSPDKEWCEECSRIIDLSAPTVEMYKQIGSLHSIQLNNEAGKKIQLHTTNTNTPNNSGFIILNEDTFFPGDSTRTLEFKLSNDTTVPTDDDFIGIAFGIRPGDVGNADGTGRPRGFDTTDPEGPADFVLLQWKDGPQSDANFESICKKSGSENNYKGVSLAHIRGEVTWNELWTRPSTPCAENTNGSFTLLSDPRINSPADIRYALGSTFPTLRVVYSKTRIQVFVDQLSDRNYRKVIDKEGIFPTHGKIGLFVLAQNAMSFKFLHATENNIAVCRPERCGDGYVATTTASGILSDIAEECDPGAEKYKNGGCDTLCRLEEGWDCSGASCEEKKGDGLVVGKEECDDGTTDTTKGCNNGKITEGWSCPKYGGKCFKITLESLKPSDGETVYYTNTPSISFSGTRAGADLSKIHVSVQKEGSEEKLCTTTATPSGDNWTAAAGCDLDTNGGVETYTVTVIGIDAEGNRQVIKQQVVYDKTKPTSSVAKLTEKESPNKELASETGKKVKVNNPDIVFTAAEDTKSLTVTITKEGGTPTTLTVTKGNDGTWKLPTHNLNLADGEYTVSVTATDKAGNVQETPSTFTFTVDTTKPTSSVAKLTKKDQIDEKLTDKDGEKVAVNNPDIVFTAAEDTKSLTVTITKKDGTPTTLTVTKGNDGTWKLPTSDLVDSEYTVSVTATDEAGNVQENPSTFTFTVDMTKPEVAITSPTTGAQSNNDKTTITGTTTELGSVTVVVTKPDNSSACRSEITIEKDEDKSWSLKECDTSEEGEYTVTVTATDEAGNQSETKTSKFVINKQAPTLEIAQSQPSYNKETKPSKITGTVKEGVTLDVVVTKTKEGNQVPVCKLNTDPTQSTWEIGEQQPCTFDDGEYTVTAVATDKANNTATKTYKFTVDTTAPTVTLVGPKEGSETKTNKQKVVVRASEDATSVQATLTPQGGGEAKTVAMTKNDDGTWSADFDGLTDGKTYDVVVVATDKAGNTSEEASTSFTVSTPPKAEIEITTDKTGKVPYKDHKATLNISGTPNTVVVTVTPKGEGKQPFTVEATQTNGQWEISLTEDHELQPGVTYEFSVTATDSSEKSSTTTKTVTVASSVDENNTSETRTQEGKRVITGEAKPGSTLIIRRKNGDNNKPQTVTVDESGKWTLTLEGDLEDAQELEYSENGGAWSRLTLGGQKEQPGDLGGYVLGGCSTTPTTPKEGLIPLLLSAFGLFFLRRRKQ